MRQLAKDIDAFLNEVILQAENQHEILIGHCTSEVALTNTQEHILMLLSEESLTNSDLARPIAEEHHHHHEHTLLTYEQVATQFTPNEQKVIQRFLTALVGEIK